MAIAGTAVGEGGTEQMQGLFTHGHFKTKMAVQTRRPPIKRRTCSNRSGR